MVADSLDNFLSHEAHRGTNASRACSIASDNHNGGYMKTPEKTLGAKPSPYYSTAAPYPKPGFQDGPIPLQPGHASNQGGCAAFPQPMCFQMMPVLRTDWVGSQGHDRITLPDQIYAVTPGQQLPPVKWTLGNVEGDRQDTGNKWETTQCASNIRARENKSERGTLNPPPKGTKNQARENRKDYFSLQSDHVAGTDGFRRPATYPSKLTNDGACFLNSTLQQCTSSLDSIDIFTKKLDIKPYSRLQRTERSTIKCKRGKPKVVPSFHPSKGLFSGTRILQPPGGSVSLVLG